MLRGVRGAADVFPDQITGKGYVEIKIDRKKAARYGINVGDVQDVVEVAMGGRPLTMTVEGRERYPVRVRYARDYRDDVEALKGILVSARGMGADAGRAGGHGRRWVRRCRRRRAGPGRPVQVPLAAVADIRVVEGPSMIKSENGLLRSYIQLRVRDRDEVGFVEEAQRVVAEKVLKTLPPGMYLEWSGTFEHQVRAQKTLRIVFPAVIAVIALILYLTHKSWIDALLMMTSVLGALAGGAIFQWLFGFHFSVAVQVGYIACFGMAVETGVVMLVYLREAIDERGGLERIGSIAELRQAILEGADPPAPAQAPDRGGGDHLDRPDALGHRRRRRGDPADGRAGARRPADRRRGDRRLPARPLLRRPEAAMGEGPSRLGALPHRRSKR